MKKAILICALVALSACSHTTEKAELKTKGVHHVGLAVYDLDTTFEFFIKALNFKKVSERPKYPAIFVSDGHTLVTLWQVSDKNKAIRFSRQKNIGLHHLALQVDSFEVLDQMYEKVKAWPGVKIQFAPELVGDGPAKHTIFYEPGGIRLELIHSSRK